MDRRLALKLVAAGFLAPPAEAASRFVSIAPLQAAPYKPAFFTPAEMAALDRLTEIILPADDHSPGASAARVNRFIDVMAADGSDRGREMWRSGLQLVDAEARERFSSPFADLTAEKQDGIVAAMAENEGDPKTELERFFSTLKRMTIEGYYTSKIGIHEDLQYQGNTAVSEFVGCTHPEHRE